VRQKQGHFTVMAPTGGLYRVCFSNRMSTVSPCHELCVRESASHIKHMNVSHSLALQMTEKLVAFSLHTGDDLFRDIAKQGALCGNTCLLA
jgi:hypothetical protein